MKIYDYKNMKYTNLKNGNIQIYMYENTNVNNIKEYVKKVKHI